MPKQCANVYSRRGRLFLATLSQTTGRYGLWFEAGPHIVVNIADGPGAIGARLSEALNASRRGLEHPANPDAVEKPLLASAGVESWSTFVRGSQHWYVERDEETLRIVPSVPDSGGFRGVKEKAVVLPGGCSPHQLGQALLDATVSD
jgi:hypothetical protein